jgi:hypothetical protein
VKGLSLVKSQSITRENVKRYFNLLEKEREENQLPDKSQDIFNAGGNGLQLNFASGR